MVFIAPVGRQSATCGDTGLAARRVAAFVRSTAMTCRLLLADRLSPVS